jgi:cytochrome c oxidase subunit 2
MSERALPLQSAFEPAGANAILIDGLANVLYIGAGTVFVIVVAIGAYAVTRGRSPPSTRAWVLGGGVVLPALALTALLAYELAIGNALSVEAPSDAPVVQLTGRRWWWEVRYLRSARGDVVATAANELHLPAGRTVKLLLDSGDVIHSFWVPQLSGKVDMIPGRMNHLVLRAERPGIYRAQCAEFCGAQHAWMALYVVAHEPEDYERWLEREARAAQEPAGTAAKRGSALFESAGCANCHTVRGTSAGGRLGPDLTHVASRLTLGAGAVAMSRGALAGWISNSQALKPGNLMPPMRVPAEDLHALTTYVAGLE